MQARLLPCLFLCPNAAVLRAGEREGDKRALYTAAGCDMLVAERNGKEEYTMEELKLSLKDGEWPFTYIDHNREIVRAIVLDGAGRYYFTRIDRDDDFGKLCTIETSGGGVEPGEDLHSAIRRELREELGAEAEVLCKIGVVEDDYNLIHRHNIQHYFLCRATAFGEKSLTQEEVETLHLSTLCLTYEEAVAEYHRCATTQLGRLLAARELPVVHRAKELIALLAAE